MASLSRALIVTLPVAAFACHPGLAPSPWSVGVANGAAPAAHAEVRTVNPGYRRTRASVLVREIDRPTRANLDYAAYHANFMIADPEPEGGAAAPGGAASVKNPFKGLIEEGTLTGDVSRTALTPAERERPLALTPLAETLSVHKIRGASELEDVVAAIRGETWGAPAAAQTPPQIPSEVFVHEASPPELWVKIEFQPWFRGLGALPDQDGDGFPELYGRIAPDHVSRDVLSFVAGDYSRKPLTAAEIKTWANQLSGYWYPSYNTDLVAPGGAFPSESTESDVRAELGGRTFASPTIVMRGKPQGKPTYDVFVVKGAGSSAGGAGTSSVAVALPKTKPSPKTGPVVASIRKELAASGGTWENWAASLASFDEVIRRVLGSAPPKVKGIAGRNGFLFYRNCLEYVLGGDLERQPKGKNPIPAIVEFKKLLEAHGVDFLFVPVPTKEEIYPDELDPRAQAIAGQVINPWERKLLLDLAAAGVETIDLLPAFLAERERDKAGNEYVFQHQDTHWTDRGLRLAAHLVAARIKDYPWYGTLRERAGLAKLGSKPLTFSQDGDLRSRLPVAQQRQYKPETLVAHQVVREDGSPYDDDPTSPVVILGDSFTGVYELMMPEHAGVSAHLALELGVPVDLVMSYGGGPNVRQKLMRRGEDALDTKKLVVWMMTTRDLYNYFEEWKLIGAK